MWVLFQIKYYSNPNGNPGTRGLSQLIKILDTAPIVKLLLRCRTPYTFLNLNTNVAVVLKSKKTVLKSNVK